MSSFMNGSPANQDGTPVPHNWFYEIAMSILPKIALCISGAMIAATMTSLYSMFLKGETHGEFPLAWPGVSTCVISGIIVALAHSRVGPIGAYRQNVDHAMKMRIIETYHMEPLATLSWKAMNGRTEFAVAPLGGEPRWVTATMPRNGGEPTLRTPNGNELAKPSEGGTP